MEKEVGFEHLHLHTDFSLLDGYGQVEEYADRIPQINQKFLCISDHGMMGAIPRQIRACEFCGISPIFGIEMYLNNMGCIDKKEVESLNESQKEEYGKNYHLLSLAYTNEGYSNLVQLSSQAYLQFYKKPRITGAQVDKHKAGIIFTSSCYIGEIGQAFDRYGSDRAEDVLKSYISRFSPNFYLEIMLIDFKKQRAYNEWLVKMHRKYGIPMLVSQDCHYCRKEDSQLQRYMLMIRGKKTIKDFENIEDGADYFELQDSNLWLKSEDELDEKYWKRELDGFSYSDIIPVEVYTQAKRNTVVVAMKTVGVEIDRSIKLPQVPNADERFTEAAIKGFGWRDLPKTNKYLNRLREEIELINRKGFASYFLIQQQICNEARRVCPQILGWGKGHEAIGPGRGCLSPETRIFLSNGDVKKLKNVVVGDEVIDRFGLSRKVKDVLSYAVNEELLKIVSYYGDHDGVVLTKDHKVLAEKLKKHPKFDTWAESTKKARRWIQEPTGDLEWLAASELKEGDWVFIPKPKREICNVNLIDLSKYCNGENLWFDDNFVYQDRWNPLTGKLQHRRVIARYITLSEQWFKIIGKFAGDGYLRSDDSHNVGFCFNSEDELDLIEEIYQFFHSMGVSIYRYQHKTKKSLQLVVRSRYIQLLFKEWFDEYQCTPQTKHVPKFIFSQSDDRKFAFLRGYLLADGGEDKHKIVFTTVSERLAYQTRYLCSLVNVPTSIQFVVRQDDRLGRKECHQFYVRSHLNDKIGIKNKKKMYQWRHLEDGILTRIRKIESITDIAKVYDLTIEKEHNYLTTSFLVHNSAVGSLVCYCLGITDVDPLKHDLLFSRFLSEARGSREMKTRFTGIPIPDEI